MEGSMLELKTKRGFNALLVECLTRHYKTRLKNAVRVYLVLEGSGAFTVNDQTHKVEQYDMFVISDGDTYEYEGKMKLFEFNIPATDSSNEDKLE
jgi:gentisate 1,2-dioxygenase